MTKELYQDVLDVIPFVDDKLTVLETSIDATPNKNTIEIELSNIYTALSAIESWAQTNYDQEEQQELLNTFLNELKTLFTTYSAVIDVVEVEAGYGVSYGSSTLAMQVSVGQNGVQASKTYATISLDQEDLP